MVRVDESSGVVVEPALTPETARAYRDGLGTVAAALLIISFGARFTVLLGEHVISIGALAGGAFVLGGVLRLPLGRLGPRLGRHALPLQIGAVAGVASPVFASLGWQTASGWASLGLLVVIVELAAVSTRVAGLLRDQRAVRRWRNAQRAVLLVVVTFAMLSVLVLLPGSGFYPEGEVPSPATEGETVLAPVIVVVGVLAGLGAVVAWALYVGAVVRLCRLLDRRSGLPLSLDRPEPAGARSWSV